MNEWIIIGGTLSVIGLVFSISVLILWKVDGDISFKQIFNDLRDFIKWHLPWSVAQMKIIEKHFNLSTKEIAMIESAVDHALLKEYIVFNADETKGYVVLKVSPVRKLIKMRRENERW